MQPEPEYIPPTYERLKVAAHLPPDFEHELIPYVLASAARNAQRAGQIALPENWDGQVFDISFSITERCYDFNVKDSWPYDAMMRASGYVLGTNLMAEEEDHPGTLPQ